MHREGVLGGVHHLQVVEEVPEDHGLGRRDPERVLDAADPDPLVRGEVHDIHPVRSRHHDLRLVAEAGQGGRGDRLGGPEVVHRELEDAVVGPVEQVGEDLLARVVLVHLLGERPVHPFEVCRSLTAHHGPHVGPGCRQVTDRPHQPVDQICRQRPRTDLARAPHDVGAVLGEEEHLLGDSGEARVEVGVLTPAGHAEQHASVEQLLHERPEVLVQHLVVVEQGSVHVGGDQPDVGPRVERRQRDAGSPVHRPGQDRLRRVVARYARYPAPAPGTRPGDQQAGIPWSPLPRCRPRPVPPPTASATGGGRCCRRAGRGRARGRPACAPRRTAIRRRRAAAAAPAVRREPSPASAASPRAPRRGGRRGRPGTAAAGMCSPNTVMVCASVPASCGPRIDRSVSVWQYTSQGGSGGIRPAAASW